MQWRNSSDRFGLVTGSLHWLMALLVIGLTALGLWMTSLTYYSPYYTSAPFWHKSLGLVFAALLVLRLIWRAATPSPGHLASHQRWERLLASGEVAVQRAHVDTGLYVHVGRDVGDDLAWPRQVRRHQSVRAQQDRAGLAVPDVGEAQAHADRTDRAAPRSEAPGNAGTKPSVAAAPRHYSRTGASRTKPSRASTRA